MRPIKFRIVTWKPWFDKWNRISSPNELTYWKNRCKKLLKERHLHIIFPFGRIVISNVWCWNPLWDCFGFIRFFGRIIDERTGELTNEY